MRAVPLASDPVEETSSEGASWLSWRMSLAPLFWSDWLVTADTAIGTEESGLARRVAVMMISPPVSASASALSAACGAGDAASCASAGMACAQRMAAMLADARVVDRRFMENLSYVCVVVGAVTRRSATIICHADFPLKSLRLQSGTVCCGFATGRTGR